MHAKYTGRVLPGVEAFSSELSDALFKALADQGPGYEPRTHHKKDNGQPLFINRLIFENSPYLLQHAHNPVNWFPWGPEAFALAAKLDRPVFLSVGYSTCHWCHVMERESFEDLEIAQYLNEHFVAIKVDREERPDVDSVYMTAVQLMTRRGGWPMTVVMTPNKRPFFGGTYFPARDGERGSRIGFLSILKRLAGAYANDRDKIVKSAQSLSEMIARASERVIPSKLPKSEALVQAAGQLASRFDPVFGGFGKAPKFPRPSVYELLLRYWRRTQDEGALKIVTHSLESMIRGGIYDQVAGGFHRYSTDAKWLVPHFEKMLYDNAQLVVLMTETFQATRNPLFEKTIRETLDYVLREMTGKNGGFYSATDADSEGEEGLFFVWTPDQIRQVLGKADGDIIEAFYNVSPGGNFEGKNILHRTRSLGEVARLFDLSEADLAKKIEAGKQRLYDSRKRRIPPILDDKVLTEWNGQMISAFARAAHVLDELRYQKAAQNAARFVLGKLKKDGRLLRAFRAGKTKHLGVLEDYAFLIAGLLDLYEADGQPGWLREAIALEAYLEAHFLDKEGGGFFATASDAEMLLVREKSIYDGAQPSGNSVAVMNLLRLAEFTSKDHYRTLAEKALLAFGTSLKNGAGECPKLASAFDYYLDRPKEIVIVTHPNDDGSSLKKVVREKFLPNKIYATTQDGAQAEALAEVLPLVKNKRALKGKATAYVCYSETCKKPTSSPEEFKQQLDQTERISAKKLALGQRP